MALGEALREPRGDVCDVFVSKAGRIRVHAVRSGERGQGLRVFAVASVGFEPPGVQGDAPEFSMPTRVFRPLEQGGEFEWGPCIGNRRLY